MLIFPACQSLLTHSVALVVLSVTTVSALHASDLPRPLDRTQAAYRMPVGLVWQDDRLFVANARTGSISMLDPKTSSVAQEWKIAESLSAIASWKDSLLVLDDDTHRLLQIIPNAQTDELNISTSIDVARYPVDIAVNADQSMVAVSSLWSHQITILEDAGNELSIKTSVEMPFAPRKLIFVGDKHLVVADAFGGFLAIVDCTTGHIINEHSVYGHNISGLALDVTNSKLLVTCQTLDAGTFTSYERVFWGVVMQNGLHSLPIQTLLSATQTTRDTVIEDPEYDGSSYASDNRYPLGTPSIGSGDPGELIVTHNDTTLLLLSGVNQVAFRTSSNLPFERLKTGRRPEAICLDASEKRAFVANRFDDSITVIALTAQSPIVENTISLGEMRELSEAEQGEQLFYDATVSLDGWFSCHSCHTNGHTNGLRADTFGDEDRGAPKKILSLLGTYDTGPWAWVGNKESLEEQIRTSLIISMQTQIDSDNLPIPQLTAFLQTLQAPPSKNAAQGIVPAEDILQLARQDFVSSGCQNCHSGRELTSNARYDVGIHDEMGETKFNPPSLRSVSQRPPFFHDGRAATLKDVLKSSHHDSENPLTDEQLERLVILLETI